jgi:hypothetical protein
MEGWTLGRNWMILMLPFKTMSYYGARKENTIVSNMRLVTTLN